MQTIKIYIKFWFRSLLFLPGTTMHEFMHYIIAVLTFSKITNFSIIPKIEWENKEPIRIVYGSVEYVPKLKIFHIPINLAPLLLLPISLYILYSFGFINTLYDFKNISFNYKPLFTLKGFLAFILAIEMFWGSRPSSQDLKNIMTGIFSVSFFITIVLLIIYYYLFILHNYSVVVNYLKGKI